MSRSTTGVGRGSRRRPRAVLATAALCAASAMLLAAPGAAPAAITTGPIDPASGFPFSYTDDVGDFALQQCQDNSGFCIETPRPDLSQPISVPDNFTEDGEGFWWLADAVVPNAGTGLARFAKESAFDLEEVAAGHQVSFARIRFRFQGLVTGATYRITHPYGVDEIVAEADPKGGGRINFTDDVGCITPPCGAFPALSGERVTSFLRWDPSEAPAAPAGYIGNAAVEHGVIGSPNATNFVRLERLIPQPQPAPPLPPVPPVPELVGETDRFVVQGKLAGAPPAPAPHLGLSAKTLDFGSRQAGGTAGPPQILRVSNHGTEAMHVDSVALADGDMGDFTATDDTCSGSDVAAGASCTVALRFAPKQSGLLAAGVTVTSNAPGGPQTVTLSGRATPAVITTPGAGTSGPGTTTIITRVVPGLGETAARPTVAGVIVRRLGIRDLSLARSLTVGRLRDRGLRMAMRLPAGTEVVRVAIFRSRDGHKSGTAIARALRLPESSGSYVITLRSRDLIRRLKPGRYVVEVTPARDLDDRGATSRATFSVAR